MREAAGWALIQGHGLDAGVGQAVERALARETDPDARADLERSLRQGADARSEI